MPCSRICGGERGGLGVWNRVSASLNYCRNVWECAIPNKCVAMGTGIALRISKWNGEENWCRRYHKCGVHPSMSKGRWQYRLRRPNGKSYGEFPSNTSLACSKHVAALATVQTLIFRAPTSWWARKCLNSCGLFAFHEIGANVEKYIPELVKRWNRNNSILTISQPIPAFRELILHDERTFYLIQRI